MKKIKIIYLISTLSFLLWIGCSDNSITNSENNSNTISGKIEKWNLGSDKILKVSASSYVSQHSVFIDSCKIDYNGNFIVKCVIPPDSVFTTFNFTDTGCYNTITVNPTDAKYSYINLMVYDSIHLIGELYRSSDSITISHAGQTMAFFFCGDRPCTITGVDSCNLNGEANVNVFDLNYIKGWNSLYLTYNVYNPPSYMRVTQSTTQPQPVKWYMSGIY